MMMTFIKLYAAWNLGIGACQTRAVPQRPRPGNVESESWVCHSA